MPSSPILETIYQQSVSDLRRLGSLPIKASKWARLLLLPGTPQTILSDDGDSHHRRSISTSLRPSSWSLSWTTSTISVARNRGLHSLTSLSSGWEQNGDPSSVEDATQTLENVQGALHVAAAQISEPLLNSPGSGYTGVSYQITRDWEDLPRIDLRDTSVNNPMG